MTVLNFKFFQKRKALRQNFSANHPEFVTISPIRISISFINLLVNVVFSNNIYIFAE